MPDEPDKKTNNYNEESIFNMLYENGTTRESMSIENIGNNVFNYIIDTKTESSALPITMRKLYAYKIAISDNRDRNRQVQKDSESSKNKTLIETENGLCTRRSSALIDNLCYIIPEEVINIKVSTKTLPITMRKLYVYKTKSINKKISSKKIVPLVMRKQLLYAKVVNG